MFVQWFWTCPACGVPCARREPSYDWWTCAAGCPKNPPVEGQPSYYTGGHPKGAVDGWYPERSPGTVKVPLPGATLEGDVAFSYKGYLVWPADHRVYVVPVSAGVTGLLQARTETRGVSPSWDTPWDGRGPMTVTEL